MTGEEKRGGAAGLALLAAVLYALSTPLSKHLLEGVGSTMLAALLYLGAGFGVLAMRLLRGRLSGAAAEKPLSRRDLPFVIGMVALDIVAPILLLAGLERTAAANVALLGNFEIVATALIALLLFREKISVRLWVAIVAVTAASILLTVENADSLRFSAGSLLVLLACACWGLENNCTRMLSEKDLMQIVVIKGFGSGLGSLCIALALGQRLPALRLLLAALLLGFVAYGLSIFCYIRAQRALGAAKTSAYYAVTPFVGAGLSLLLFHTELHGLFWLALTLMLWGAYLASSGGEHGHSHNGVRSIDFFAYASRLSRWNATFKALFALVLLILCVVADQVAVSVCIIVSMAALIVGKGGLAFHEYLALLSVPLLFLLLSGVTIAVEITGVPAGEYGVSLGFCYLSTTAAGVRTAIALTCKALGAVSAMYFLTLTTPACEIVSVLRRAHLPKLVIELMYLIYRFIFVLLDMQGRMQKAAEARMGYRDFRTACRSFGGTAGNLLVLSFQKANTYYDAMLSRAYRGDMRFLEEEKPVKRAQVLGAAAYVAALLFLWLVGMGKVG